MKISEVFKEHNIQNAFLKEAMLALTMYPLGCRASNDIDLLVSFGYITLCGNLLKKLGFIQGVYDIQNNTVNPSNCYYIRK